MISRLFALLFIFPLLAVSAAQLDVAVLQFPEPKSAEEVNRTLSHLSLPDITDIDNSVTKIPTLKGGRILFSQSLPSSTAFQSQCRLSNNQASMEGRYENGVLSLKITLSESVTVGFRRLTNRIFQVSSKLPVGQPRVIGIRNIEVKKKTASKGNLTVEEDFTCNVILAQIR